MGNTTEKIGKLHPKYLALHLKRRVLQFIDRRNHKKTLSDALRNNVTHICTKEGKSVYKQQGKYITVTSYPQKIASIPDTLKPAMPPYKIINKNVISYETVDNLGRVPPKKERLFLQQISRPVIVINVYDLLRYTKTLLRFAPKIKKEITKEILQHIDINKKIECAICHGDMHSGHIGTHHNKIVAIDWDDWFIYEKNYDYIYYSVVEYANKKHNKIDYATLLNMIKLTKGHSFNDTINTLKFITPSTPEYSIIMFIFPFAIRAYRESLRARVLLEKKYHVI